MRIQAYDDAKAFRDAVEPYLARHEPRHDLLYGLASTLVEHPEVYPVHHCWRIVADGETAGAALRTPPHLLVLAAPARDDVEPGLGWDEDETRRRIGYRLVCGSAMIHFTP